MFSDFIQASMKLELNDQQKMIQKMVQEFAEKEVGPIAAELDKNEEYPTKTLEKMSKLGFLGLIAIVVIGAVILPMQFACKHAYAITNIAAEAVREQLGIPTLIFGCDPYDSREVTSETIKERISEFLTQVVL